MKLYHYTSIASFEMIWENKSLKFSVSKTTNDIFERNKSLRLTKGSFPSTQDADVIRSFFDAVFQEIESYRQISLTKDYLDLKGYASPMMWGQYARSKVQDNKWYDGVCLELDSSKLIRPQEHFYEGEVCYKTDVPMPCLEGINPSLSNAGELYVSKNQKLLFFTKHKHWENENEYRLVCKGTGYLDISNAVTGIYALEDSYALTRVCELVDNKSLVFFLSLGGADNLHLVPTNLKLYNNFINYI